MPDSADFRMASIFFCSLPHLLPFPASMSVAAPFTLEETMKTIEQHRKECQELFTSLEDKHAGAWVALTIIGGLVAGLVFRVMV